MIVGEERLLYSERQALYNLSSDIAIRLWREVCFTEFKPRNGHRVQTRRRLEQIKQQNVGRAVARRTLCPTLAAKQPPRSGEMHRLHISSRELATAPQWVSYFAQV